MQSHADDGLSVVQKKRGIAAFFEIFSHIFQVRNMVFFDPVGKGLNVFGIDRLGRGDSCQVESEIEGLGFDSLGKFHLIQYIKMGREGQSLEK